MSDNPDIIGKADLLKYHHDRYNHITGLRSTTARHYMGLVSLAGGIVAGFAAFTARSGCPGDSLRAMVDSLLKERELVAWLILLPGLVGVFTVTYDSMARKVAAGPCKAIGLLIGESAHPEPNEPKTKVLAWVWTSLGFPFRLLDEEFFFSASVMAVTAVQLGTSVCLACSADLSLSSWLVCVVESFICIALWALLVFKLYPTSGFALSDSNRNPIWGVKGTNITPPAPPATAQPVDKERPMASGKESQPSTDVH